MRLPQKGRSLVGVTLLITVGALVGTPLVVAVLRPQSTAFLRGDLLYRDLGCVACHGPDGIGGVANPGSGLGEIPALRLGAGIKAFIRSESEIRE